MYFFFLVFCLYLVSLLYFYYPFHIIILSYLIFSFLLFSQFDEYLIFSPINESFLKSGNDIYFFLFLFLFLLLWLSGLTNYFSVCVLSGALSSSYYFFFLLFFLHLGLSSFFFFFFLFFFFCIFLRWHFNNFAKLHNRHIEWIYIWEIVKHPRLDYGHDSWYIYINTLFFLLDESRIIHHNSILSIKTIPSMNAAMKFLWNDKQPWYSSLI